MNDNKTKRRDKRYTAVAVKDDKIVMFFFQKYTLFVFRSTPGKLFCGSNVVFKGKFLKKYIGLSQQNYLKNGLFPRVLLFNVFLVNSRLLEPPRDWRK